MNSTTKRRIPALHQALALAACAFFLASMATAASAQRFGGRGGGGFAERGEGLRGGGGLQQRFGGGAAEGRGEGEAGGRFGGQHEGRFGGEQGGEEGFAGRSRSGDGSAAPASGSGTGQRANRRGEGQQKATASAPAGGSGSGDGSATSRRGSAQRNESTSTTSSASSSGGGKTYDTRNGGTVDGSKTTSGDTTDRTVTYENPNGDSATHSGSVTKGDGSASYTGSSSNSAGASSHSSASATYSNGQIDSANTSFSGSNKYGESGSHDGNWDRNGDTVHYDGSTSTSTGKWSESAGSVTKTDDGFVAHGATVNSQGAGAGTVVKDGDQVYGRSVTTNYDTVTRSRTECTNGNCTTGSITTAPVTVQQYNASPYYYYPQYYAYYACPPGSATVVMGGAGTSVYSCGVTPVISTTIPLTAMMMAAAGKAHGQQQASTAQVTSSPVVMYRVASDTVVYATSYGPEGMYWQENHGRSYWVPGAAQGTSTVKGSIEHAAAMKTPTANATVITYTIGGTRIYLTNEPPLAGIYAQRADVLYAWIPGVTTPSEAQHDAIATAVTAHEQEGAQALAGEVQKLEQGKPAPS